MKRQNQLDGGDCYEAAVQLLLRLGEGALLVHGEVVGQGRIDGIRYGHAWVELNGSVLDPSNGMLRAFIAEEYFAIGKIDRTKLLRYSLHEAMEWMRKTEHYGPWER